MYIYIYLYNCIYICIYTQHILAVHVGSSHVRIAKFIDDGWIITALWLDSQAGRIPNSIDGQTDSLMAGGRNGWLDSHWCIDGWIAKGCMSGDDHLR